jgi:hypothetical protein
MKRTVYAVDRFGFALFPLATVVADIIEPVRRKPGCSVFVERKGSDLTPFFPRTRVNAVGWMRMWFVVPVRRAPGRPGTSGLNWANGHGQLCEK